MTTGERIRRLRHEKNLGQQELSQLLGYKTYTTISKWESNDSMPRGKDLKHLAQVFNVSTDYILGVSDERYPTNISAVERFIKIPVLGTISCGDPITATENVEEYKERMADGLPKGDVFYLRCKGDSMSPVIPDQALVLCKVQPDVESGEIAAVLVNGDEEATLKRIRKLSGSILLEPENNAYEPILVNEENPARILGKACEVVYGL